MEVIGHVPCSSSFNNICDKSNGQKLCNSSSLQKYPPIKNAVSSSLLKETEFRSKLYEIVENDYSDVVVSMDLEVKVSQKKSNQGNYEKMLDKLPNEEDNTSSYNCKLLISPEMTGQDGDKISRNTKTIKPCIEVYANSNHVTSNQHGKMSNKATSTSTYISRSTST